MVKLMCFIVGEARHCGFSVEIDLNESVRNLKQAIKEKISPTWKNDEADKLQLFLAKKDGEWLNGDY
ncbi:hypothetical protein P3T76_007525 [Phytophthora citrophthora]|uniref:Crinkler effector protein N-terminal domain-containing protein n=1 Tax=Phytophthora citrophthora TaxID=4793 RepID=A0AAD9GLV7_9STRA|nr:hypothetical protein P3T76_007525 [Phytophthora citrophthora]